MVALLARTACPNAIIIVFRNQSEDFQAGGGQRCLGLRRSRNPCARAQHTHKVAIVQNDFADKQQPGKLVLSLCTKLMIERRKIVKMPSLLMEDNQKIMQTKIRNSLFPDTPEQTTLPIRNQITTQSPFSKYVHSTLLVTLKTGYS